MSNQTFYKKFISLWQDEDPDYKPKPNRLLQLIKKIIKIIVGFFIK